MKIFISYRRADSENDTVRIAKSLKRHFGDANVVLDTEDFGVGKDFRNEIKQQLHESDMVLVIIGAHWSLILLERFMLSTPDKPDWVMQEIEIAIQEKKIVIPVTLNETIVPDEGDLPYSIRQLSNNNGIKLRTNPYNLPNDMQSLIQKIEKITGTFRKPEPNTPEELPYLLLTSKWRYTSPNHMDEYICEANSTYRIVIESDCSECGRNYHSEWSDKLFGQHSTCKVHVKHYGDTLAYEYFVSIWDGNYLIPMPKTDYSQQTPIYYWHVNSLAMLLLPHIYQMTAFPHTGYKSLEDLAAHANIEFRE